MIEFVCGRSGSGKTEYVMNAISQSVTESEKVYLIVPDQQAVAAERTAAAILPPTAFLKLEIVSFSRLADLVARRYGNLNYSEIGENGRMLIMWSAVLSVWDSLKIYGGTAPGSEDRFVPELLRAVNELQMYAVTPDMLEEAADRLRDSGSEAENRLADRISEIALVYSAYMSLSAERGCHPDLLENLDSQLRGRDFFRNSHVYIDSFFTLTAQEMNILRHIFRDARKVTMTFCTHRGGGSHFSHISDFMRRAENLAGRYGEVTYMELHENHRAASPMLRHLEENLWADSAAPYDGEYDGSVSLVSCTDRYHGAKCIAARINQLVQSGARYSEIAVVAADMEAHREILDRALDKCGVPYFLSQRREVSRSPAAKLLCSGISFAGGGWRREDLIECLRTGLCPVSDDEADMLDIYTAAWNIRGRTAYCSGDWTLNPDGYSTSLTAVAKYTLDTANSARRKLTAPFEHLADSIEGGGSVESYCRAAVQFLLETEVYRSLLRRADKMEAEGRVADAAAERGVWNALMSALDVMAQTVGDITVDTARFVRILHKVIDGADVGAIPDGIDRVILGSAGSVRANGVRHVIIAEAAAGIFPAAAAESGLFSDTDKQRLDGVGITLSPDRDGVQREEMFAFYRTVALAADSLTVIVPRSDGSRALEEGVGVAALRALLPRLEYAKMNSPFELLWCEASAADTLASYPDRGAERALADCGIALRLSDDVPLDAATDFIPADTAAALAGDTLRLTQSRLDSFYSCPFAYHCRYTLRLREDGEAKLRAVDVGNFMHRILELFVSSLRDRDPADVTEEEIAAAADSLIAEYKGELFGAAAVPARIEYMFTRLRRSAVLFFRTLVSEFAQSKFRPEYFELVIGSPGAPPAVKLPLSEGGDMEIGGTIDRVDLWRDGDVTYARVVDYKTGLKKFSFADLATGYNMQLPIYLYTVVNAPDGDFRRTAAGEGELLPAGALYFSARPGDGTADSAVDGDEAKDLAAKGIERGGFLLGDERVLRAMDEEGKGRYIPAVITDKGIKKSNYVRTAAELEDAFEAMKESLTRLGGELKGGKCAAFPTPHSGKSPCEYCGMKNICRVKGGSDADTEEGEVSDNG